MFIRLLRESIARNPRRKLLTASALLLGMAVATATFTVAVDVGEQLAREFRSLGANLLVTPQSDTLPVEIGGVDYRPVSEGAYLQVADLPKLKTIFWRNNILGFTPFLDVPVALTLTNSAGRPRETRATLIGTWYRHEVPLADGTSFLTGASVTHTWWQVRGQWFTENSNQCVAGASLAEREGIATGDELDLNAVGRAVPATVTGIVTTGGAEDDAILCPLTLAEDLAGKPGAFRQLFVSALTKPADAFAAKDPNTMTPTEYDRWYCSPYISSIGHQIEQVLPGTEVRAIRRVAETEGRVLSRVSLLLWIVTIAALIAAALAVAATSATTVMERRAEIGLMKALGATNISVGTLFLSEQLLLAIGGGALGFLLGAGLARELGVTVFGVATSPRIILLPVILAAAILVVVAGSCVPLYRASRFSPAPILRGE
ncbi:MAG TPA: ABC transporter permease [Candidatus Acidoferrales bacterium]|nr:ABC transporter permease [Candidatus Acidoferrales bacterium]